MDKFQVSFEILYFSSAIDGKVDKNELEIILNFLNDNKSKIKFDPHKTTKSIGSLTTKGVLNELTKAASMFKRENTASDRVALLDFGMQLIVANGKVTEDEAKLLFALGSLWNIDMPHYIESKLS